MQSIKERFIAHNIPYEELDKELIEIIDLLNFKANLKTKYCCIGHKELDRFYVMFDEEIDSEEVNQFAVRVIHKLTHTFDVTFKYWVRATGRDGSPQIKRNWMMESKRVSQSKRNELVKEIIDVLKLKY